MRDELFYRRYWSVFRVDDREDEAYYAAHFLAILMDELFVVKHAGVIATRQEIW